MSGTPWRPLGTVAAFSILPFAVFVNDNRSQGVLDLDIALYSLFLLVPGLVVVAVAAWRGGPVAAERAAVVFAAAAFVLFHYQAARSVAELFSDSDAAAIAVWLVAFCAAVAVAVRISSHQIAWNYMLVAGALLLALPVLQYSLFAATEDSAAADGGAGVPDLAGAPPPEKLPNVYFFLLDGYGRADQLSSIVGHDNGPFLAELERRGFVVRDEATAAYPTTFLSVASTLEMDYPAGEGELADHAPYYEAMGGDNASVRALEGLGYRFVMGTDYSSLECGPDVDACVEPPADAEGVGGERESAILEATPLATILPELGLDFRPLAGYLSPEDMVDAVEAEGSGAPVFAYGHLLTPHPPYRYLEDCSLREDLSDPGLDLWGEASGAGGEGYRRAVECVNEELLRSVERIVAADPDAVIVIQGDHGPKFGIHFHRPLGEWTPAQLEQRFSLLSAQRLPRGCEEDGPLAELPVNTFRIVLGCLAGSDPGLLEERHYMIDLEAEEVEEAPGLGASP